VDPEAIARAATWERVRKRPSIRTLLDADRSEAMESGIRPSSLAALAPPSKEVRQEMARLRAELDAAAELEAREQEARELEALGAGGSGTEPETPVRDAGAVAEDLSG
jgi:hypothetical protein